MTNVIKLAVWAMIEVQIIVGKDGEMVDDAAGVVSTDINKGAEIGSGVASTHS